MAKLQTIEINFMGVQFTLEGVHNKKIPATHEQPEEGGNFEIHSIHIAGNNVTEILNEYTFEALTNYINENINNLL